MLESRGDYQAAIGPLMDSARYSRGKNWRCFAELAKAYTRIGYREQAVQALEQAISLAEQAREEQAVRELRMALDALQRDSTKGAQ
jgi:tetratricopeptide (TPR) repeat protein